MPESAVVISTNDLRHEEWLNARTHGIGGSDAGVILGLNRYKTPFELWLEKTGQVHPVSSDNEAAYFGNILEDVVAKEFERRSGKKVRRRNAILKHPKHDFIRANVDRLVVGEKAVLECKTASAFLMKEWEGEEVPASYLVQMQHYLGVLGSEYKKGYFAVLIGGQKFIWKEIERDDELIKMIFEAEKDFWEKHVLANVPPALDGSSAAEQFLKERYTKTEPGKSVDLKHEYKDKIEEYLSLKDTIKELEVQAKALENDIKNELKEAETGFVGPYQATWKPITSSRVDTKLLKSQFPNIYEQVVKPSTYRKFGIKKIG
jgi:putative phage-type endonuclease